jgi:hypothetical protein
MPSKRQYPFTCVADRGFANVRDAALDVHLVDKDETEISPKLALPAEAEQRGAKQDSKTKNSSGGCQRRR